MPEDITAPHNHQRCVDSAMATARQICQRRDSRLTPIRETVLAIVWSSHKPIGAYGILERLAEGQAKPPAPPTVYRALEFLLEHKLVHRIASLNAFVGCNDPSHRHEGHFLICQSCSVAIEMDSSAINAAIDTAAKRQHFTVTGQCVEVAGLCQQCDEGQAV
ncbi:transcriptional repressor [Spongiibacter taiwanensis]|uniref:Fur family transcriptional regulator n=1 Tax=Spongiibacter taiwanensis TaxID=1748242 RepID=UPI002036550E|nr:Fur family transcriptional regulator [Spongiibacter taiwanensis]USA41750.1 transcriptional repressor [Spongiibacter taiwanensis]